MHATLRAPELSATSNTVSVWIMLLSLDRRRLGEGGLHLPPLALRDRSVFDDSDLVPDVAGVRLVVGHELRIAAHVLLVLGVLHQALDPHHHRLVHLVAHDHAYERAPHTAIAHSPAPRFSRRIVSARAMSRRSVRS